MNPIDLTIILVYVAGVTALGAWLGKGETGLKGYFLGESNIPVWALMVSIVATETSAVTFLSVPGVAYGGDFRFLQLAIGYVLGRALVATVLLPAYFRGEIYTAYQLLEQRFGGPTRTVASLIFLVTRLLADGIRLFVSAKIIQMITGWPIEYAIVALGVATIVYTFLGGMKAVIWTELIQFLIYNVGATIALWLMVAKLPGGWGELWSVGESAHKFRMFDFRFDLSIELTFWSGLIGGMVLNTATHGVDQIMVQRYLSARSEKQAAVALVASGAIIFAQFALFLLIGVGLYVFYRQNPPGATLGKDDVFVYYIVRNLPVGIMGLVVASVFSVAMGTLSGSLNASASSTVNDLVRPILGDWDEVTMLRMSRWLTAFWGLVRIVVAFGAIGMTTSVVSAVLAIAGFTTGILLGVFLLGQFTRRTGQTSAMLGMIAGASAVSYAKFATSLAWPWFALLGASTVFCVGWIASLVVSEPIRKPQPEPTAP